MVEEESVAQLFERIRGQEKAPPVFDRFVACGADEGMRIWCGVEWPAEIVMCRRMVYWRAVYSSIVQQQ